MYLYLYAVRGIAHMCSPCLEEAEMLHLFLFVKYSVMDSFLPLPFWLMQFQLKLPKYSSVKIQEVETNYRERMHLTEPMLV